MYCPSRLVRSRMALSSAREMSFVVDPALLLRKIVRMDDRDGPTARYPPRIVTTIEESAGSTHASAATPRAATRVNRSAPARSTRRPAPILVRQMRGGVEESVHRGDVVEVDVDGALIRGLGDPDRVVNLRSCVKPFGVVALIEAGG